MEICVALMLICIIQCQDTFITKDNETVNASLVDINDQELNNRDFACFTLQSMKWDQIKTLPQFNVKDKKERQRNKRKAKAMMLYKCQCLLPREVYNRAFEMDNMALLNYTLFSYLEIDVEECLKPEFDWSLSEEERLAIQTTEEEEESTAAIAKEFKKLLGDPLISLCLQVANEKIEKDDEIVRRFFSPNRSENEVRSKLFGLLVTECIDKWRALDRESVGTSASVEVELNYTIFEAEEFDWNLTELEKPFGRGLELLQQFEDGDIIDNSNVDSIRQYIGSLLNLIKSNIISKNETTEAPVQISESQTLNVSVNDAETLSSNISDELVFSNLSEINLIEDSNTQEISNMKTEL